MYKTKKVHVFATYLPRDTRVSFHNKFRMYFEVNVLMIHHHKTIQLVAGQSTWNLPFLKTGFLRKLKNYDASVICTVIDCISYHLCAIIFSNLQNKNLFCVFIQLFNRFFGGMYSQILNFMKETRFILKYFLVFFVLVHVNTRGVNKDFLSSKNQST